MIWKVHILIQIIISIFNWKFFFNYLSLQKEGPNDLIFHKLQLEVSNALINCVRHDFKTFLFFNKILNINCEYYILAS